jgi:hypothetical protein
MPVIATPFTNAFFIKISDGEIVTHGHYDCIGESVLSWVTSPDYIKE